MHLMCFLVMQLAKKHDPSGERSIAVITRPDKSGGIDIWDAVNSAAEKYGLGRGCVVVRSASQLSGGSMHLQMKEAASACSSCRESEAGSTAWR